MKKINNNNDFLKVKAVENLDDVKIMEYAQDVFISQIFDNYYMIIKRKFKNKNCKSSDKKIRFNNVICEIKDIKQIDENLNLELEYGDEDSIIVDMNGIDNFRFAKELIFQDYDVRRMIIKLGLLEKDKYYYRFGCSGARECDFHPGGEVFESILLNGKDGSGISQSVSGYLPNNSKFSKSISLFDQTKQYLREERIVYSHTAFLKECGIDNSKCIYIKIKPEKNDVSLLDIMCELAKRLELSSYAIQMCIKNNNDITEYNTKIKGRVLKHLPKEPFEKLQDATDIGLEQLFELNDNEIMYGVGTNYLRYEPEWKEFTGGRQYERRGHIHATIVGNIKNNKHEVFHLRDSFVSPSSEIHLVLTPVDNVYKIYSIYKKNNHYYCKTTDKDINVLIKDIRLLEKN